MLTVSGTTYDVITFLICITQKREYLQNEKRYAKKENAIPPYSKMPGWLSWYSASLFWPRGEGAGGIQWRLRV